MGDLTPEGHGGDLDGWEEGGLSSGSGGDGLAGSRGELVSPSGMEGI